ncbi:Serine/threonine kinase [Mortierella polycephala]|uniref:protein kinase C n=1 Tax=Mortierella polycephala TaxID=41804 RepID=A0A9P6PXC4_9FUNG|nr:Serine/threonine kinase [Mortierella polycephala]
MNDEQKLEDLRKRLERENEILNATRNIRKIQTSEAARASSDITIEETQQRIDYFQNEMSKLLSRLLDHTPSSGHASTATVEPVSSHHSRSDGSSHSRQPSNTSVNPGPFEEVSLSKPLSTVDLLRSSKTITTNKVIYKMHELAYKLEVEKKVRQASEKLEQLGAAAKDGSEESKEKVILLKRALQKYQGLYIPGQDDSSIPAPGTALRRPMTGILNIRIAGIKHQSNAQTRHSRPAESMAAIKIDGALKGKTRMARNGAQGIRWNEDFEIPISKASEIEITVYDRPDHTAIPIGMFWLKVSDLVEELRRKKVEADNDAVWAATNVHDLAVKSPGGRLRSGSMSEADIGGPEGVEAWWDLEPAGQIGLGFSFVKDVAIRKRVSKLGRQGAVRKRKGEVQEIRGHKFVSQKFYQIMCCALCNELFTGRGSQCEDCSFACHSKCAEQVFIKCISSKAEDPDDAKLNHRIPHRFETFTNLSPNWCYHCGYMLTFGRRHKSCSECPVFAHDGCSDLIPDHCGMSAETANKLMEEIKRRNQNAKHQKKPSDAGGELYTHMAHTAVSEKHPEPDQERLQQHMQQLKLEQQQQQQELEQQRQQQQQQQQQQYLQQQQQILHQQEQQRAAEEQQRQRQKEQHKAQLQQQQIYQQQLQQQQQQQPIGPEMSPVYNQAQEQAMGQSGRPEVVRDNDMFRREQQRLELLRLEQERAQQHQQQFKQEQQQQQRPIPVMPKPHIPTLKIVNKQSAQQTRKLGLKDFHFFAVLGRGNFGKVMLAEDKKGGELYAIKALKKDSIVQHDEVESARSEKRIFQVANKERHPFLTTLHSCFQTDTRLYFVMEYVRGGDLMMHIQKDRRFGERRAKFYGCEVLLALQYFHKNDIVYRDLKLDNILLSMDGHIKIADYGLCKENMPHGVTTRTICGTPDFMAPEIIEERPYDRSVDWWAFGVLMYEMLLGRAPFSGEEEDDIYDSIMDDEPVFPHGFGRNEQALLQSLLMKVPHLRLGSGPGDAEEIKSHAYFRDVNFDDVYHKRIPPPFLPTVSSSKDVSNFDPEFTSESPSETPSDYKLNHVEQGFFQGFSYVSPWIQP